MNAENFFKEMYHDIWQSNDLSKFDKYYSKDFEEIISVSDENKNPIDLHLTYQDLLTQAILRKENYTNTTIDIKKLLVSGDEHISVHFYSTSIEKHTKEIKYRCVCGIWRLNKEGKIDRAWAVVTPYYSNKQL